MEALLERMQRQGKGRGFLTSCEAELQELMKQIDIMVAHKKAEWESQTQALESCLDIREHELSSLRNALDEKRREIERLCQQLEGMEQLNHDITMEYEQQLKNVQEELARLKRSYEKLQKKQLKEARQASKNHVEEKFEVSILSKKLEEFRQKSLDWEKQRLRYQQHVASLEVQRKALAEQSELIQTQLSSRKQMFETVELASQSEIHHLTSKLERANDTLCANELEVERLNMRVDDLTDTNRKILDEQERIQDELKMSRNSLEVLREEKIELRATLLSQEDFINSLKVQHEQLQKEVFRLSETLHTKEVIIRSLEECLQNSEGTKEIYHDGVESDHILLQLDHAQGNHLEGSLGSANAKCLQLSEELTEKCHKLRFTEEHLCQAKAEIKKLKEQLFHMEQSHSSELEGMKQEVSHLTRELHQRDITIASSSGSTLGLEQQLRTEIEKAEQKAVEQKAVLSQLEAVKQENQHLSEMLQKAKDAPLVELKESYTKALSEVESKNQQLQNELSETRAIMEESSRISQDTHDSIVLQMQQQVTEVKNTESRRMQEMQCKHEEDMRAFQAQFDRTVQHYEEELKRVQHLAAKTTSMSSTTVGPSPQISSDSVQSAEDPFFRLESAHDVSRESLLRDEKNNSLLCALPTTDIGAAAAKFLEEEEVRSQHILECLDAHIEELKRDSEKTLQHYTHQK
ncbi:centrosomal protein of 63 kDa isoform X3 [Hemicordylus capensis]|nr:centrosomal protein of 63 kDa isoform X3 [Hemicordylus capensis]XP_053165073.1 centrosomal protein of 63 kDa isoform X3 [Hemicordylus capensis]XP_053165074.1 centrosomal protein of 63 kDa isoform X3 [Hemicordylus capensis]XP_053165075.1 centrosomal protein of 63 kDa isoform X3 [Hemicordylus capensis]XP_053165076.1 centrosomal protein of 63 kDa isoform X3 [Hemicordylus capensis]XP_053165077.1 centrosomal protein of 63 kDa isoform X3 [Hemicordylus capensis]XP_053165078.1 centrosomal protein 